MHCKRWPSAIKNTSLRYLYSCTFLISWSSQVINFCLYSFCLSPAPSVSYSFLQVFCELCPASPQQSSNEVPPTDCSIPEMARTRWAHSPWFINTIFLSWQAPKSQNASMLPYQTLTPFLASQVWALQPECARARGWRTNVPEIPVLLTENREMQIFLC